MRQDCKYFESRTYQNGDTVRKCDLDLAPEAPWRCPENCPKYTRRMADVNWSHGSLVTPATPDEPESVGKDDSVAALLDAAEEIINGAVPAAVADLEAERRAREGGVFRRATRRFGTGRKRRSEKNENTQPRGTGKSQKGNGEGIGEKFRRRYREGG